MLAGSSRGKEPGWIQLRVHRGGKRRLLEAVEVTVYQVILVFEMR